MQHLRSVTWQEGNNIIYNFKLYFLSLIKQIYLLMSLIWVELNLVLFYFFRPAVCLVVSGPGFVHALAGMANSNENAWPLIVIGGSSETILESCMAFQEFPQVGAAKYFAKYAARPSSLTQLPFFIEKVTFLSKYIIFKSNLY